MSVRPALLAILHQGPCYGYQLRTEFERRTGSTRPLNVGQIYNTLDRLERDGLVTRGDTDAQGHVYYEITAAGTAAVDAWLASPVGRGQAADLAIKIAVASTLPGVDVAAVIRTQRRATRTRLRALEQAAYPGANAGGAEEAAWRVVTDAMTFAADAELRWLDHAEQRLAQHPSGAFALPLARERPRRGRPSQAA